MKIYIVIKCSKLKWNHEQQASGFSLPSLKRRPWKHVVDLFYTIRGDYMANFSPGWDFTSASWTNLLKKTFAITWREFQPGLNFSPGWDFQPGLWNRAGIFSPGWNSEKPHVIALKFQPGLKSELERAQWLCFQRNKMAVSHFSPQFQISARAETSHVIATKFQPGLKLAM